LRSRHGCWRCSAALVSLALAIGCHRAGTNGGGQPFAVVQDAAGRSVRLDAEPHRVISLIPATTEMVLALGAGGRLVARTDYDTEPALDTLPSVGGGLTPSLEWLVRRRPDLVIAWPDSRARDVVARMRGLGIAVYAARLETLADIRTTIENLGRLLGVPTRGDSLVAQLDSGLDATSRAAAGMDRPRVLYLESMNPPLAAGSHTFVGQLIDVAGGRNVFADARAPWPQVSLEAIVARDPDVILMPVAGDTADALATLRSAPDWKDLRAVRGGRVYGVPADLFSRPGPHVDEIARRLAHVLHPRTQAGQP
jgi:ABC-type Fe3+-hydroxamate transport system substrate-binding protein